MLARARTMKTGPSEEFVGDELVPVPGTAEVAGMSRREPGLPQRFTWRGTEYSVVGVIEQWKSHGPCRSGGGETYLRRHWYKILTDPPAVLTVYFERQARTAKRPKARWWIYSRAEAEGPGTAARRTREP